MSVAGVKGTIVSGKVSLTNATPSAVILPALPAGQRYYVYDIIMTTSDTAQPLVTLTDAATAPNQILKAYVNNTSPTAAYSQIGTPTDVGTKAAVTAAAGAVTAAKTIEIRCTALISST